MTKIKSRPWAGTAYVNRDGDSASIPLPSDKSVPVWFAEAVTEVNEDRADDLRNRSMATFALDYARHGIAVFPLTDEKRPFFAKTTECRASNCTGCHRFGHGCNDASTDLDRVRSMWQLAGAEAPIAGRLPGELVVLDVDPRNGGEAWLSAQPPLAPTLTVISGRNDGGRHLYYTAPTVWLSPRPLQNAGVDLKTSRGYVVLPPSRHGVTGMPYRFDFTVPLPQPLPGWLVELLAVEDVGRADGQLRHTAAGAATVSAWAGRASDGQVLRGLTRVVRRSEPGNRNSALYWASCQAAGHIARGVLVPDRAWAALLEAAARVGLSRAEAQATIRSAFAQIARSA